MQAQMMREEQCKGKCTHKIDKICTTLQALASSLYLAFKAFQTIPTYFDALASKLLNNMLC